MSHSSRKNSCPASAGLDLERSEGYCITCGQHGTGQGEWWAGQCRPLARKLPGGCVAGRGPALQRACKHSAMHAPGANSCPVLGRRCRQRRPLRLCAQPPPRPHQEGHVAAHCGAGVRHRLARRQQVCQACLAAPCGAWRRRRRARTQRCAVRHWHVLHASQKEPGRSPAGPGEPKPKAAWRLQPRGLTRVAHNQHFYAPQPVGVIRPAGLAAEELVYVVHAGARVPRPTGSLPPRGALFPLTIYRHWVMSTRRAVRAASCRAPAGEPCAGNNSRRAS